MWKREEQQTDKKNESEKPKMFKSSKGRERGDWGWIKKAGKVGCAQRACKESHFKASKHQGIRGGGK